MIPSRVEPWSAALQKRWRHQRRSTYLPTRLLWRTRDQKKLILIPSGLVVASMEMSGTTTTTSSTLADWAQLYHHSPFTDQQQAETEATVVTATTSSISGGTSTGGVHNAMQLNSSDRRAGKPARRRSRASRKVPTTMLNTDTSNFRAMVQQFTGFPSAGAQQMVHQPARCTDQFDQQPQMGAPFGMQQQPTQLLFHQYHRHQHQQQHEGRMMFSLGNNTSPFGSAFVGGSSNDDANNSNPRASNTMLSGGFGVEGIPSQQVIHNPSSTADPRTSSDVFMFNA